MSTWSKYPFIIAYLKIIDKYQVQKSHSLLKFSCGGSNPTTTDDIIYTLVSSAVGHLCQCKGSMNVLNWVKLIDTYNLGHWGRAEVIRCPDTIWTKDKEHWMTL